MKKNGLVASCVLCAVAGHAADLFTLSFSTTDYGSNKNILAGYITASDGAFVDTIGLYSGNDYLSKLTSWKRASGIASYQYVAADAYMGATRSTFFSPDPVVFVWDLADTAGATVPDGTYTVHLEIVNESQGRKYGSFDFEKNSVAGTRTVSDFSQFTGVSVVYDPPSLDADGDGMLDAWENLNGLNASTNDAALDLDGDGYSNYSEYIAGTDPQLSTSLLMLATPSVNIGTSLLTLNWSSVTGKSYGVQAYVEGGWSNEQSSVVATPPTNTLDLSIVNQTSMLYRVVVEE